MLSWSEVTPDSKVTPDSEVTSNDGTIISYYMYTYILDIECKSGLQTKFDESCLNLHSKSGVTQNEGQVENWILLSIYPPIHESKSDSPYAFIFCAKYKRNKNQIWNHSRSG